MARALRTRAAPAGSTNGEKKNHIDGFRKAFSDLYEVLDYAEKKYGKSREFSLAFTKLEESQMWLNKAISNSEAEEEEE